MELKSNIAHTSSSDDFGKGFSFGFAFSQIELEDLQATGKANSIASGIANGQEIPMTREEVALASFATPEGVDYAYNSGEFYGISDLEAEGIASEVIDTLITDGVADGDYTPAEAFTGFDPTRADFFAEEVGEELVSLAREIAEELGAEADPAEFLSELRRRQTELRDEDREVLARSRRLGALAEPEREAGSVCRLTDHGEANLRMVDGELLLVPAGADAEDVEEAAARSREARFGGAVRLRREAIVSKAIDRLAAGPETLCGILAYLGEGYEEGKALLRELISGRRLRAKVIARPGDDLDATDERERDRALRRARKVVGLAGTGDTAMVRAGAIADDLERKARSNRMDAARRARARGSKAFPAPVVPFGGTPVKPEEQEEVLYIERLKATARELAEAQPDSPAAKTARAITRRSRVSAFYGDAHGVAHAAPAEPWFERTTVIFDPEGVFATRRSRSLADLVEAATESLFGEGSSVTVEFDPNAWADRLPQADRESGPDQRGASAPREYADAHRRDAVLHTATGRALNPSRNARQKAAAVKRVAAALKRGEGISPSERAWRTALSIHLGETEHPAERLLLMLQTRGRRKWADLESGAANPAGLKAAARELADAGRLKLLRGRVSGARYIEATEALEGEKRAELERALLRLMVTGRVAVPKGTRLARRVAAHKGWMAREPRAQANAQAKAQANLPAA